MQQQRAADEALHLLEQMRREQHGLPLGQKPEQYLIEILAVEHVVAREGLVHQDIVRALREREHRLKLVLLPRGAAPDRPILRQGEERHQRVKPVVDEVREVRSVKFPVLLRVQGGEEAVLARGKRKPRDVRTRDRLPVQRDLALKFCQTENALHQRRLARAVLAEEAHNLPPRQRERHIRERLPASVFFRNMFDFQHGLSSSQHGHWNMLGSPSAGASQK